MSDIGHRVFLGRDGQLNLEEARRRVNSWMQEDEGKNDLHALAKFNMKEFIGPYELSTVKLVCDHNWVEGHEPLWFESMVFLQGSSSDLHCDRYTTAKQARDGHVALAEKLENGWRPDAV